MTAHWYEKITGPLEDKKRWRAYKKRVQQLPTGYRTATEGVERYLMYTGPDGDSDQLLQMFDDLADLFERAALDETSIADVVGDDPVEFVETFKANYGFSSWLGKEQRRLIETIKNAEDSR